MAEGSREQIRIFLKEWPDAEYGPGHIALSDYNLSDVHIRWCVSLCRAALSGKVSDLEQPYVMRDQLQLANMSFQKVESGDVALMDKVGWYRDHDRDELTATITFLEQLLLIPENERDADG